MKTAMQELIEKINYSIQNSKGDYKMHFSWVKSHCIMLLEKEKEQILNAYQQGNGDAGWLEDKYEPQEYYNQTYNQKK